LKGKFKLSKKPPEYSNFAVSASGNIVVSAYNAKEFKDWTSALCCSSNQLCNV